MVPFEGGPSGGRFARAWDGTPAKPAVEQATFWAAANRCDPTPRTVDHGAYQLTRHECPARLGVAMYAVKDNGHAWPGGQKGSRAGDSPSATLNATQVIWEFFESHPRQ
jgi:polyhydroxybutyrate depolymerase